MSSDLKSDTREVVLEVRSLPTLPKVLDKVTELLENPESSMEEIAKIISTDQVLSAKVLKMVNSPIYGFPGRIGSVQHALVLLGVNVIRGIIISTSVFDMMVKAMQGLWEHSVGCALACNCIARKVGFKDPEEYSVAGLLHDLGKVVMAVQLPEMEQQVMQTVKARDVSYFEAEKLVMGFGHDRINAWLADNWHLPPNLKEGMSYHHKPQLAPLYPDIAAVIHVGDFLVRVFEFGSGGDDQVPVLLPEALRQLKLKTQDLEEIMDTLGRELVDVADLNFS
ncbi:putative signal transduction protein [Desulfovibrio sp. X2]|uniref:HDOD domain-containing protein n=1 Tax=Desulfovibrio sp. X2 TaxID=941449 RepID=UPI0003588561|nr:HDOD domain-containing protein [Desulfovibrio sp. X2]EPR39352.1 putative signal transduction protein [Desulfovibrio sp. X2]